MEGVSVIYTTHYIEEAERICNRLAIMDKGKIILEGSSAELLAGLPKWNIEIVFDPDYDSRLISQMEALTNVETINKVGKKIQLEVTEFQKTLNSILDMVYGNKITIKNLGVHGSTIETLFLRLTGKKLRE